MTIFTDLFNYKDGSVVEIEQRIGRECFTTDNFFSFWEKLKENYSDAVVEVTSRCSELSNFFTDSEEILYIKCSFNYSRSYWAVRACDLRNFLSASKFYCDCYKYIHIHNIYTYAPPINNYTPWTPENEVRA